MSKEDIRVYIDETRHLRSNPGPMVLGGLWGKADVLESFSRKVKVLRAKYEIPTNRETKWTKVSPAKLPYYLDILRLFMTTEGVNYRAVIIDKALVKNDVFHQTDDDFYYRMQYYVVRHIAERHTATFQLYFDYKDTWSMYRCRKTADYLNKTRRLSHNKNALGDQFTAQLVQSYESIPLQVVDLLNGMVAFANSEPSRRPSKAKRKVVDELKKISPVAINANSPYAADKVNLLFWKPEEK